MACCMRVVSKAPVLQKYCAEAVFIQKIILKKILVKRQTFFFICVVFLSYADADISGIGVVQRLEIVEKYGVFFLSDMSY